MKRQVEKYACDNCGAPLLGPSPLNIVTSKSEASMAWSRLHVKIEHRHGYHNNADTEDADLCRRCADILLTDALERIRNRKRASAGTEHSEQQGWGR